MVLLDPREPRADNRGPRKWKQLLWLLVLTSWFYGCSSVPVAITPTPTPRPTERPMPTSDPDVIQFPNGHTVSGAFRRFWQAVDGPLLFGTPLTAAHWIDGQRVQYFERARFELGADGRVRLGALGTEVIAQQQLSSQPAGRRAECQYFEATGHNVCGAFRDFWQRGGEEIFGRPMTEAIRQGATQTQYFEQARLEQTDGGAVRLAQLGDEVLARVPAHLVLRFPGHLPAARPAKLTVAQPVVQPLETVESTLDTDSGHGTATVFWGDAAGRFWASSGMLDNAQATVSHVAQGALGRQGAVVMVAGKIAGVTTELYTLTATSAIVTGQPRFDEMLPRVKAFMDQDISVYSFGEHTVRGYRSPDNNLLWLRDHVHQGKGYAYWEQDMTSLLDQFRRYQHADGSFDDYLGVFDFGMVRGRKEVEADLEYLFVEGVYRAWQATGDDAWLRQQVPAMERGLRYALTHPLRWDTTHRLVKRPYTIDTWDFEIGPPTVAPDGKVAPRHWIDADTRWSIFHGDNTGYAQAMNLLAAMYTHLGEHERAEHWRGEARGLIERLNAIAWNGWFYRHMVPLVPVDLPVDPEQQLSLSNAYALNRGVLADDQAAAIIAEYQSRRRRPDQAFAEWYSIDPPFPAGVVSIPEADKGHRPGEYVNGGIMPLVGGELAQGAFRYGQEGYGFDILQRYHSLIAGTGASYLWYYPLGQPGISGSDTLPTDGWGASAMLAALVEGAAGVRDRASAFTEVSLAPRWAAVPDVQTAHVSIRYGASDGYVAYHWTRSARNLRLRWTGNGDRADLHLLLPGGIPETIHLSVNGRPVQPVLSRVGQSRYVDLERLPPGELVITW